MDNHPAAYPVSANHRLYGANRLTIEEKIKAYLAATCLINFDDNGVDNDTDLFQTGLIDSYGFVELIVFLEREFALKVTDDDLVSVPFNSVSELVGYVREKQDAS
jgi:D-alanine--poly(phosphoribitol) ligase subunit 2